MANRITSFSQLVIAVSMILSLLTSGCAKPVPTDAVSTQLPQPTENQTAPTVTTPQERPSGGGEPSPGWTLKVSFTDGAPALNRVAQLKVVAEHKTYVLDDVRVQVILPEGFDLVSGNLTWSAKSLPYGETEVINAQVRAARTGNWTIPVRLSGLSNMGTFPQGGANYDIYVSVQENSSEWRLYPPYGQPTGLGLPEDRPVNPPTPPPAPYTPREAASPLKIELAISELPVLNRVVKVTGKVSVPIDTTNVTAQIKLPAGAVLVKGALEWQGNVTANQSVLFSADIVFKEIGKWAIEADAGHTIDQKNSWGDLDIIYLKVGATASTIGWEPGPVRIKETKPGDARATKVVANDVPEEVTFAGLKDSLKNLPTPPSVSVNGTGVSTKTSGGILPLSAGISTIYGDWKYFTKAGDYRNAPLDPNPVPAKIFLVELQSGPGAWLGYAYTDTNGRFTIPNIDPSNGVRMRMWAYVKYDVPSYPELRVVYTGNSLTGLQDVFCTNFSDTYYFDNDGGTYYMGEKVLESGFSGDGAFWIKDDLDRAFSFPGSAPWPGSATVKWDESRTDPLGNHYDYDITDQIQLVGEAERRPDAVIHEYGHRVMDNTYGSIPATNYGPDGDHHLFWNEDANTAWVEGWADFLALAVNGNPEYTRVDGFPDNLEDPTWGYYPGQPPAPEYTTSEGDTVEGRVAGALWDIFDSHSDDPYQGHSYDQISDGFGRIWSAFTSSPYHNTFVEFWDTLKGLFGDQAQQILPARAIFQNTIVYPELRLFLDVNISPPGSGTVSKNPDLPNYQVNGGVTLTAYPITGWHFSQWGGDIASGSNPTVVIMDFDKNVAATFAIDRYFLTATSTTGGNVTTPVEGTYYYDTGTVVNLVATPDTGWHFINWTGPVANPNAASTTITMDANYSIQANFAINTYALTYTAGANGSISGTSPQTVNYGGSGTAVTAMSNTGYHFVNWSDSSTENPRTDTNVTTNINVTANFAPDAQYSLTTSSTTGGDVTTPGEGTFDNYYYGQPVPLVAAPDSGWYFLYWAGNNSTIANPTAASTNITMYGNYSITAVFSIIPSMLAETSLSQAINNGVVVAPINIDRVKDITTNQTVPGIIIGLYSANATYPSSSINMTGLVGGDSPFGSPAFTINNPGGTTVFSQDPSGGAAPAITVARLVPILTGSALSSYSLTATFTAISATIGADIPQESPAAKVYRRGDAKQDGAVNVYDSLFIAQYIVGQRPLEQINALNAASPKHDFAYGDAIDISDALYISQYIVGQRDDYFNPIGGARASFMPIAEGRVTADAGSAIASLDRSVAIPIRIKGIPADSAGLGGFVLKLAFDPKVVTIEDVTPGKGGFSGEPVFKIDNVKGEVILAGVHPEMPGATGDVIVAYVILKAKGTASAATRLDISVIQLAGSLGENIAAKDSDGVVTIR